VDAIVYSGPEREREEGLFSRTVESCFVAGGCAEVNDLHVISNSAHSLTVKIKEYTSATMVLPLPLFSPPNSRLA
jgi:hypothetical protein